MKRALSTFTLAALLTLALTAPGAQASFGLHGLGVSASAEDGTLAVQAGSHPDQLTFSLAANTALDPETGKTIPEEEVKDLKVAFPPGLVGDPTVVPRCTVVQLLAGLGGVHGNECPNASALGRGRVEYGYPGLFTNPTGYNLEPPPRPAAKFGVIVADRTALVS